MNESFKTDPSLATSARAAKECGSYLCASNVTPTAVRFIVSVFLCLLCSCRMSSTQMTCSHFRKNRPKKRQKPAGCRSRIISKNRPVPIFGRSTGASLQSAMQMEKKGEGRKCLHVELQKALSLDPIMLTVLTGLFKSEFSSVLTHTNTHTHQLFHCSLEQQLPWAAAIDFHSWCNIARITSLHINSLATVQHELWTWI